MKRVLPPCERQRTPFGMPALGKALPGPDSPTLPLRGMVISYVVSYLLLLLRSGRGYCPAERARARGERGIIQLGQDPLDDFAGLPVKERFGAAVLLVHQPLGIQPEQVQCGG